MIRLVGGLRCDMTNSDTYLFIATKPLLINYNLKSHFYVNAGLPLMCFKVWNQGSINHNISFTHKAHAIVWGMQHA